MQIVLKNTGNYELSFKYHAHIVKLLRNIPDRKFDPKQKVWIVPESSKKALKQVAEIVNRFQRVEWQREEAIDQTGDKYYIPALPELTVPHGLNYEPKPYQGPGIAYGLETKRFMNADDMGLGKTFETIGTLHIANAFPCLVVCPGNVKINWQREWMKFANRKAMVLNDDVVSSWPFYAKSGLYDVFIVNFESLRKYFVQTIRTPRGKPMLFNHIQFKQTIDLFKSVVIDESHRCGDFGAQQTKFAIGIANGLAERKEWKITLTGTPVVNNHVALIPQLRLMGRIDDFGGERYFRQRYCAGPNKASNGRELSAKLRQICFFRRTKAEVKGDFLPVTRQIITCEISNRKEYDFAQKDFTNYLANYKNESDDKQKKQMKKVAFQKFNVLAQISAKGKIKALIEHAKDFQSTGKKLLIYAELHAVVDQLMKAFPKAVCVTGRQNSIEKQRSIDAFSRNPKVTLCVISSAGGTGTDGLQQQCSEIDFIEHPWHDAGCSQIESRLDRPPQNEPVIARFWQGENTVDEKKWKIVEIKKKISDAIMKGKDLNDDSIADLAIDMFMEEIN